MRESLLVAGLAMLLLVCPARQASGQVEPLTYPSDPIDVEIERLQMQVAEQAAALQELRELVEAEQSDLPFGVVDISDDSACDARTAERVPLYVEVPTETDCDGDAVENSAKALDYYATYDRGFSIRAFDDKRHPYELNINGWIQFRHHGFARDVGSWTDQTGVTRPVQNRNAFDIERSRLVFFRACRRPPADLLSVIGWRHGRRARSRLLRLLVGLEVLGRV